jgi:crotonobetainyl-CoA:carnitine CoA-transferase CaiB-like acyl-CoA transferase
MPVKILLPVSLMNLPISVSAGGTPEHQGFTGMADCLLHGFRALDLTDEKGFICGKILAAMGVETIKIEKPGGDPSRRIPPFFHDIEDAEHSLYWQAFNTGKLGITLDLTKKQDQGKFRRLAARSDFIVESFTPGYMDSLGCGYRVLNKINPSIILTSISPFGQKGPYARYKGNELVLSAMSGVLLTNGDPDRPPVREGPDCIYMRGGVAAALGTIIAHYHRELTGKGQQVDVSLQEVDAGRTTTNLIVWQFDKQLRKRSGPSRSFGIHKTPWIWPCKDGFLFWQLYGSTMGAPANSALSAWISDDGLENPLAKVKNWNEFDMSAISGDALDIIRTAIGRFFMNHTRDEIAVEGLRREINACVINTPADVLRIAQLKARDYWNDLTQDDGSTLTFPKYFFLSDITENFIRNRAPHVGEHNDLILPEILTSPFRPVHEENSPARQSDLDHQALLGINVLDFGWAVAGSLVGKYLADHGAQVIRVESGKRLDATRNSRLISASSGNNPDDKPWFTHLNTSKLSLAVNLKHAKSKNIMDRLIKWADIVNENFTPGTMSKLGFNYDYMKSINPDIIMVSGSVYGQSGPMSQQWGVDGTGAALSGYLALTGWPDRTPVGPHVPYGDVVLPLMNALAAVAALDYRRRTGMGQHIDGSMLDTCVHQITPALLDLQANNRLQTRSGNRIPYACPHGVFPCCGNDQWCAIAVFTDDEWKSLAAIIGNPALINEPKFSTLKSRKQHEDELEQLVASWTMLHTKEQVMEILQASGVPAGAVQTMQDIMDSDPQLQERGFLVPIKHPILGVFGHPVPPFKLSKTPAKVKTSPCLGEHNEYICTKLLGISDSEFVELLQQGVFE